MSNGGNIRKIGDEYECGAFRSGMRGRELRPFAKGVRIVKAKLVRLLRIVLVGVLAFSETTSAEGQESLPPSIDKPAADPTPSPETAPESSNAADTEREWSGPARKAEAQKSFWEKVPPILPYPRPGNFYIAPSGPGYYTILDAIRGNELPDRPKNPYLQWGQNPNPFYNADFRYLDDPKNTETDFLDPLKRLHLGDEWLFSTGGEIRNRYSSIQNAALYNKSPQAGSHDNFDLFRARFYGNLWYLDRFRLYAEFITAQSSPQSIPNASSDIERNDFLNLFVEAKISSIDDHGVYARIGRQELLFGSQRLISVSDWGNARRTFDGARFTWHNDKIEEDLFVVNPVVPSTSTISKPDYRQLFAGNWFKYRFNKDISLDAYYLYLENDNPGVAKGRYKDLGGYDVNTFGSRFVGDSNQFLFDFEGALQLGGYANQQTYAGMYVAGLGYWFKNLPAAPTLWAYYDYASGDPNPGGSNVHRTFNTLFPFGHAYFAGLDTIGRQNIKDFHLEAGLFPFDWMRIIGGYHVLSLDSPKDALYNASGSVVRQDTTGKSGTDVGQAINGVVQFHIDNHQMFLINYSHLFSGQFIKDTAVNSRAARDIDAWWFQYTFKY